MPTPLLRRIALSVIGIVVLGLAAHTQTIGLQTYGAGNTDGYILFAPVPYTSTYLIDKCGRKVHEWPSTYQPGQSVYLLDDGTLLRTGNTNNPSFNSGGRGGAVQRIAPDGTVLWSYLISDAQQCSHHDVCPMPNGHVLVIAWERHTLAQATAAGRDPDLIGNAMWSEKILELEPVGTDQANIVWEWHLWDHLVQDFDATKPNYGVVADHPELMDLNYVNGGNNPDWIHANAIDYNAALDQILLSAHNPCEVWIIDHSTASTEAATHSGGSGGHGGDLLYRWGNPRVYDRGTTDDQQFFGQHNAQWIRDGLPHAGDILVFNNGVGRPETPYSSIDRFTPPVDANGHYPIDASASYAPTAVNYEWTADWPASFYAQNISGVQELPNGGFVVCEGPAGNFFELDANGDEVWRYISPVNTDGPMTQGDAAMNDPVFRCTLIPPGHPGLSAFSLTPGDPIELDPIAGPCTSTAVEATASIMPLTIAPVPTSGLLTITGAWPPATSITVLDALGRVILRMTAASGASQVLDLSGLPDGCYAIGVEHGAERRTARIIVAH